MMPTPVNSQTEMRPGFLSPLARRQYAALAWVQTRIFVNSLRTRRGGVELGAKVAAFVIFAVVAVGPAAGLGFSAWAMTSEGHLRAVALLLWVLCLVWQVFSALAPALAGQNPELSHLLRYPVTFGSWILLYLVYGLAAPSSLIGTLWAVAIGIGISAARPDLLGWTALTLAVFVLFNLLLSRMILAWIERWLAQRRTREIVTGILLFLALGAQALNPAFHQHHGGLMLGVREATVERIGDNAWKIQRALPPGLASESIALAMEHRGGRAGEPLGWLVLYTLGAAALLAWRLRAESRGENLNEAPRRVSAAKARAQARPGGLMDFPGPIAAVFEKDLRTLLRSGPMLYNLAAPLVMAVVFGGAMHGGQYSRFRVEYALPVGMAWAFLGLTRLVCNNLGGEGAGLQFYFLSPTPLRTVVVGKNLLHLTLFVVEAAVIAALIVFRFGAPSPSIVAATVAWILFAVPANFTAGNLLSVRMPYRLNLSRIRREPGALGNGLMSVLVQFSLLAAGGLVVVPCQEFGHPWAAPGILVLMAGVSGLLYLRVLAGINDLRQTRVEALMFELAK
jgi:ABC-2 type transport system permease protein